MQEEAGRELTDRECREAMALMRRVIAAKARGISKDDLDDCVGEALTRLVRAVRRERPRIMEAFQVTIAMRVAFGWIDRQRHERRFVRIDPDLPSPEPSVGIRYMFWLVREYFLQAAVECVPLFDKRSEGYEWEEVARDLQKTSEAVRQQWTRCCRKARDAFMAEGGMIAKWLQWAT